MESLQLYYTCIEFSLIPWKFERVEGEVVETVAKVVDEKVGHDAQCY